MLRSSRLAIGCTYDHLLYNRSWWIFPDERNCCLPTSSIAADPIVAIARLYWLLFVVRTNNGGDLLVQL